MRGRINWIEFMIDFGDTIGGIGIGVASQKEDSMPMLIGSIILILVSTALKFRKHKIE